MIKISIFIGILIMIGVGVYYQLGGFNKVSYSIEDRENIKLIGLTYRGTPQDEKMGQTFRKIESLIKNYPEANLHTIYYSEPAGKLDTLQVFVGFEYKDQWDTLENLEVKIIPCSQVIVAKIQAHRLVMAGPIKVKEELEIFAKENKVATLGIYVDRIMDNDYVEVIAPLKQWE